MKRNFVFSFLFFHLPWERVQREEPKCRCNPAPTAVGDRHVGTTVRLKMTSGFSTSRPNALRSLPSQHLQDSWCPLLFICTIFTSCSNLLLRQISYFLHKWAPQLHHVISRQSGVKRAGTVPFPYQVLERSREIFTLLPQHQWRTAEDCISLKHTWLQNQISD